MIKPRIQLRDIKISSINLQKTFPIDEPCIIINKENCEAWLTSFRGSNYQQNTLYGVTKILKIFLAFLFEYNYTMVFKLNSNVTFKPENKPIIIFSKEDTQLLLSNLKRKNENFQTIFLLLFYTGLRPSDLYLIETKDIDLKQSTMKYYSQKTNDYNIIPIHPKLKTFLEKVISKKGDGKLIEYSDYKNIGKAFRRYLKELGLDKKGYTLRTFRKTFISLAHDSGVDLATVAKLVGHKKITTTEKYYNYLSNSKKASELEKIQFPDISSETEVQTEVHFLL